MSKIAQTIHCHMALPFAIFGKSKNGNFWRTELRTSYGGLKVSEFNQEFISEICSDNNLDVKTNFFDFLDFCLVFPLLDETPWCAHLTRSRWWFLQGPTYFQFSTTCKSLTYFGQKKIVWNHKLYQEAFEAWKGPTVSAKINWTCV